MRFANRLLAAGLFLFLSTSARADTLLSIGNPFSGEWRANATLQVGVYNPYSDVFSTTSAGGSYIDPDTGLWTNPTRTVWTPGYKNTPNNGLSLLVHDTGTYPDPPIHGINGSSTPNSHRSDDLYGGYSKIGEAHAWVNTNPEPIGDEGEQRAYDTARVFTGWRDVIFFDAGQFISGYRTISIDMLMDATWDLSEGRPGFGAQMYLGANYASASFGNGLLTSVMRNFSQSKTGDDGNVLASYDAWISNGQTITSSCNDSNGTACFIDAKTVRLTFDVPLNTAIVLNGYINLVANSGASVDAGNSSAIVRINVPTDTTWTSLSGASYRYSPVPIPPAVMLMGSGLVLLFSGALRRQIIA